MIRIMCVSTTTAGMPKVVPSTQFAEVYQKAGLCIDGSGDGHLKIIIVAVETGIIAKNFFIFLAAPVRMAVLMGGAKGELLCQERHLSVSCC